MNAGDISALVSQCANFFFPATTIIRYTQIFGGCKINNASYFMNHEQCTTHLVVELVIALPATTKNVNMTEIAKISEHSAHILGTFH